MNESLPTPEEEPAAILPVNGQVMVKLKGGKVLTTDSVLYALGRDGNTRDLGLKELGIPINKYGLLEKKSADPKRGHPDGFDPITYQTKVPSIYVAGDVIGAPALASTSMEQGRLAMCHAFGIDLQVQARPHPARRHLHDPGDLPGRARPRRTASARRSPTSSARSVYGNHGRGQIIGDTEGMVKMLFEVPSGKLLGVHVIGEIASELVHIGLACPHVRRRHRLLHPHGLQLPDARRRVQVRRLQRPGQVEQGARGRGHGRRPFEQGGTGSGGR